MRSVNKLLALSLLVACPAQAIPLVYQCDIVDYTKQGAIKTDFEYQIGEALTFKSDLSEARVYLDKEGRQLTLSLRPRDQTENYTYSTAIGYDLPKRLDVILAKEIDQKDFAARLSCRL